MPRLHTSNQHHKSTTCQIRIYSFMNYKPMFKITTTKNRRYQFSISRFNTHICSEMFRIVVVAWLCCRHVMCVCGNALFSCAKAGSSGLPAMLLSLSANYHRQWALCVRTIRGVPPSVFYCTRINTTTTIHTHTPLLIAGASPSQRASFNYARARRARNRIAKTCNYRVVLIPHASIWFGK